MRFGIIANPDKYAIREPLVQICNWCSRNGHEIYLLPSLHSILDNETGAVSTNDEATIVASSDVIIGIGGDGTMLYTARLVGMSGKPILGVNSGRLGFLANLQHDEIDS